MSGTEPGGRNFGRGDPTRPFHPDGAGGGGSPPPDNLPKIPGITLQYEIARGGMGVVYSGRQDFLDRRVAVKFLSVELGGPSFAQRFQREAKILAGIKHPNIVACHMADTTADGQSYLVMEFIDGPSLKSWIADNGPIAPIAALRLTRATAQALAHAYQSDVIHRDVKPENILLETLTSTAIDVNFPFTPKLVDLGLARMTHEQAGMGLTSPGSVMGTPATMSPEQFDDPDSVDFRSDIYGLGCCLFEMLVGQPAYRGNKLTEIIMRKRAPIAPDPCEVLATLPAAVGSLTQRMLASNRDDRPASYKELDEELVGLMQVLAAAPGSHTVVTPRLDQTGATMVGRGRPGQRQPSDTDAAQSSGAESTNTQSTGTKTQPGAPPPDAAAASGPGLLHTAELDFLSGPSGAGAPSSRTQFRDGSSGPLPTGPAGSSGSGAATRSTKKAGSGQAAGSRLPLVPIVALAVIAAGVGVWFGLQGNGNDDGGLTGDTGPVINSFVGMATADVGLSFPLTVDASSKTGGELAYAWQWPKGALPETPTGEPSVRFRLIDGLPGVELEFVVQVSDRKGGAVATRRHTVVVGDCPEEHPLIGFKTKRDWRASGSWTDVSDPLNPYVSGRALGGEATLTTAIGREDYWEWFGTLTPTEDEDGDGRMSLAFTFDDTGYALRCTREQNDTVGTAELVLRDPDQGGWRSLVEPVRVRWQQPEDTDDEYGAWFLVRREQNQLTLQIGLSIQPPAPFGEDLPEAQLTRQPPVLVELSEQQAKAMNESGRVLLSVEQGRGVFRIKLR